MGQSNNEYLKAYWSKTQKDITYSHPDHKWNSRLLHHVFTRRDQPVSYDQDPKNFFEELDARGYDLTTFRFSIRKKKAPEQGP